MDMGVLDTLVLLAVQLSFAFLAIRTVVSWARQPDRRHGNLAIALTSLAGMIMLSPLLGGIGTGAQLLTDGVLVLFLLSGYGLFTFRDSFVPFRRPAMRLMTVAIVAVGVIDLVIGLPSSPQDAHTALQGLALVATIGIWAYCILEPTVTFWRAAMGRPAVEHARLRALSYGYALLLLIIVLGTLGGALTFGPTGLFEVAALAIVPVLYVAFFPPAWLRRIWRQPEEDQFRHALHDLLLYSPDRATLAERALQWAARLVGGDEAFVIDSDGSVLATRGIGHDDAETIAKRAGIDAESDAGGAVDPSPWRAGSTIVIPLDLRQGQGSMVLVSGRLSPMFGDDELSRLRQYAASIVAGLDRASLSSKIAALERAKTDFLNVASHELRGPTTVIKGYLTMLESGALGDLSAKARSVLPLLISKSDEISWMLEQMIEASRLEEGKLAIKRERMDIVELTDSAVDGMRMLLPGHQVRIDEARKPIEADVDPDRFKIVVRNLLSNAAKYSAAGSDIDVAVMRNGENAKVMVKDRGVGISAADQKQLFTRFGRIEGTVNVPGTGLGLWLSREIALMHDGDLTVDSELGTGSTFTFSVPLSH